MFESRFPHPHVTTEHPGPWSFNAWYDGGHEPMVWTENYLGHRGRHVWAHPDRNEQIGCHISPEGDCGIGLRHAEPVLTWTSPYPDGTRIRLCGRYSSDSTPHGRATYRRFAPVCWQCHGYDATADWKTIVESIPPGARVIFDNIPAVSLDEGMRICDALNQLRGENS